MIQILIDNQDLESFFDIKVLDYSEVFGFAEVREDDLQWFDKSGVDPNLSNVRYSEREFSIKFLVYANNIKLAKDKIQTLIDYTFSNRVFILSIRDVDNGIREAFLCKRASDIKPTINIREQDSIYVSTIVFTDINPNAIKYYNEVSSNTSIIDYTKGVIANIYYGNGDRDVVENSGTYTKSDYSSDGPVDIIIDTDLQAGTVSSLNADFTADITSGVKEQTVNFTDSSTGTVVLWSWDFGDGQTSSEQNPTHTYTESGAYTVTLQIFNDVGGSSSEIKTNYINVRNARLLISSNYSLLINNTNRVLIN